jgi:hypothetical protein
MSNRKRGATYAALALLIIVALLAMGAGTQFDWIVAKKVTVQSGGLDVAGVTVLADALDVSGASTFNSTLDVDGAVSSGAGAFTITDSVNITGAVDVDSTFNADGNSSVGGTFAVTGDTSLGADLSVAFQDPFTVVNALPITPTGTVQEITASGAVSTNLIADAAGSGTILVLINASSNVITLAEAGGNIVMSGDIALGQWDTITLINRVGSWYQLATSNN